MVITKYIFLQTKGNTDIINITQQCSDIINSINFSNGIINIFNPGSTGALTTIEYEPNVVKDLKETLEELVPSDKFYHHSKTWNDDNGVSHIRSAFIGPSIVIPFIDKKLTLGTWQQIIFCDFDTCSRSRKLIVQIIGE